MLTHACSTRPMLLLIDQMLRLRSVASALRLAIHRHHAQSSNEIVVTARLQFTDTMHSCPMGLW